MADRAKLHQYGSVYNPAGSRLSEQIDQTVNAATHNNLNQITTRGGAGRMLFEGTANWPGGDKARKPYEHHTPPTP